MGELFKMTCLCGATARAHLTQNFDGGHVVQKRRNDDETPVALLSCPVPVECASKQGFFSASTNDICIGSFFVVGALLYTQDVQPYPWPLLTGRQELDLPAGTT